MPCSLCYEAMTPTRRHFISISSVSRTLIATQLTARAEYASKDGVRPASRVPTGAGGTHSRGCRRPEATSSSSSDTTSTHGVPAQDTGAVLLSDMGGMYDADSAGLSRVRHADMYADAAGLFPHG